MDFNFIQEFIQFVALSGVKKVTVETPELKISVENYNSEQIVPTITPPSNTTSVKATQFLQKNQNLSNTTTSHLNRTSPGLNSLHQDQIGSKQEKKFFTVKSPLVGKFYRRPSPDRPDFVKIGEQINKGTVVCVIEAMKLFNEIESEVSGKVVKILLDDATPVEFDQPVILIELIP